METLRTTTSKTTITILLAYLANCRAFQSASLTTSISLFIPRSLSLSKLLLLILLHHLLPLSILPLTQFHFYWSGS